MESPHESISQEQWIHWTKKRKRTVYGYMLVGVVIGIDYSFMFTTLYLYLKEVIKVEQPNFYYGIIIAAYNFTSTFFGMVFGRWIDKTRKIKRYVIFALIFQITGCLLYVIPFSVVFPLVGRGLCGLGDPFPSVVTGELIRIHDEVEGTKALWRLASVYSIGFLVGPIMTLFFKNVDFYLLSIHFNQLNVIAIFMAGLLLITIIVAIFLIHDCSEEIDLKKLLNDEASKLKENNDVECNDCTSINDGECNNCTTIIDGDHNPKNADETKSLLGSSQSESSQNIPSIKVVFKTLFSNVNSVLLLTSTLVFSYCLLACDILQPLIVEEVLHWPLEALTLMLVVNGILYFILLMVNSKYCTSDRSIYIMSLVAIVALIFSFIALVSIKVLSRNLVRDVILCVILVVTSLSGWLIEEVIIRCLLAKMVPSNVQSFVETIRNGVSRISTIVASITAPLALPFLKWWSAGLILVMVILLFGFLFKRKSLVHIKQIEFKK